MKPNLLKVLVVVTTAAVTSGCAGGVSFQVKEENKDPASSYDGTYVGTVKHPGGRQDMGNRWYNNCSAQDFSFQVKVDDSQVTLPWNNGITAKGYVDADGRFRVSESLGDGARASNTVMSDNSVELIVQGILEQGSMKGRLVYGMGQFNGRGCTYPVSYQANG